MIASRFKTFFGLLLIVLIAFNANLFAQKKAEPVAPISLSKDGKLVYAPNEKGDRIPDFSYAGYKGGDEEIRLEIRLVQGSDDLPARILRPPAGALHPPLQAGLGRT